MRRKPKKMHFSSYLYQHKQAFNICLGYWRESFFSKLFTVIVIGLAWALPVILLVILENAQSLTQQWKKSTDISVYLKQDTTQKQVKALKNKLSKDSDIAKLDYVSSQKGLEVFLKQTGFKQIMDSLDKNPLPPVLVIRPAIAQKEQIQALYQKLKKLPEAEYVKMDMSWLTRFYGILNLGKQIAYSLMILFGAVVLFIIAHAMHLGMQKQKKEVEVYLLVGATNSFVRRPFLYLGLIYGILGAAVSLVLVSLLLFLLKGSVKNLAVLYGSQFALKGLDILQILSLFLMSISLCWLASWLGVRRIES